MANTANKVNFGFKKLYYSIATIAADGTATYGEMKAFPGAVSISLDPQGDTSPFYADDIVYYQTVANNGYEGDLEVASIPEDFEENVLGFGLDTNNVLTEDADATPVHFALAFEFNGDQKARRHVLYNCVVTRSAISGQTKEDTIEPQTSTLTITATTIVRDGKNIVKSSTSADTTSAVYDAWFTKIYDGTATE